MKKVKQLKKWGIYELSTKEQQEYGFSYAVIHPDVMETGLLTASDTDWECESLEAAISWVENYDRPRITMGSFLAKKLNLRG